MSSILSSCLINGLLVLRLIFLTQTVIKTSALEFCFINHSRLWAQQWVPADHGDIYVLSKVWFYS